MRVLVVDDDRIVLASCERVLQAEGHEVITAVSSRAGLKILEHGRFDLLLVDIKMPEYDGIELTRVVQRSFPEIPIIAMSGYSTDETVAEALTIGAKRYIAKPFLPEELLEAVAEVTGNGPGPKPGPEGRP